MNTEQWEALVENISNKFPGAEIGAEEVEPGVSADAIIFSAPNGRFKIVRKKRPLVLEKKLHYSHRPGDTARTEYKFSETEFSFKLKVYKENDDLEWQEVTLDQLGL